MELTHDFEVGLPVERAWTVLTDVERIAPCLPGAQLQEVAGEEYRGVVKVKVGPITAQYKGVATFAEKDDTAHRAVLDASGRDTRGQGNARATITAELTAAGDDRTRVALTTDLTVSGKVAQFGRGVMADVSNKLLGTFVDNLETMLAEQGQVDAAAVASADEKETPPTTDAAPEPDGEADDVAPEPKLEPAVRTIDSGHVAPIDLLDAAGSSVAKRALPLAAIIVALLVLLGLRRRRRKAG